MQPVYTDRANFVTYCSSVCLSKTCTALRVPCERKADLCKFLSVQKFVRTLVNWATVTLSKIKSLICFQHFIIIKPDFWKRQQKLPPKLPILKKKLRVLRVYPLLFFFSSFLPPCSLFFSFPSVIFELVVCKNLPFSSFRLSFVFKKTARYISLHKKANFFNWMQCCFGSLSHSKFCIGKTHAKILAKT